MMCINRYINRYAIYYMSISIYEYITIYLYEKRKRERFMIHYMHFTYITYIKLHIYIYIKIMLLKTYISSEMPLKQIKKKQKRGRIIQAVK